MRQQELKEFVSMDRFNTRKREVYEALQSAGFATSLELSGTLKRSIHMIMPRLTELRKEGFIEVRGTQSINGRSYSVYCLSPPKVK